MMACRALVLVLLVLSGCALVPKPDYYPQKGMPNTKTYAQSSTGGEVTVYELSGLWIGRGYVPDGTATVQITQEREEFSGIKTSMASTVIKGSATIRGKVEGNLVHCQVYGIPGGWGIASTDKIEKDGNSFKCWNPIGAIVFERIR